MLCERCQQKEAVKIVKQTINGNTKVMHLCSNCASAMLHGGIFSDHPFANFMNFLSHAEQTRKGTGKECSKCRMTLEEIMKTGRVGCQECYQTFACELLRPIESIHGKANHIGKIPHSAGQALQKKRLLQTYQQELQHSIEAQEFEKAAELRDKIRALEGGDEA